MSNQAVKRNLSSMQVLKTLQLLLEGNFTMAELIEQLNRDTSEPIFNNSVVSKYINTCRYCGIEIPKIQNKYFVASLPFGLNLSDRDLDLLETLQNCARESSTKKSNLIFDGLMQKLSNYSNKKIVRSEENNRKLFLEAFTDAIQDNRKINLLYRVKASLECIPIRIVKQGDRAFFNVYYKGKEKLISANRISGIEVLDKRFSPAEYAREEVIFKLTGDLAQRYSQREHEDVLDDNGEYIIIKNKGESKKELFSRLLRYDSCCEILQPIKYRDEMKELLNNMLSNYGV